MSQSLVLIIYNEWSQFLDPPPVPHLALASTHPLGLVNLVDVSPGLNAVKEDHRLLGLAVSLDFVGYNKRNFRSFLDLVT